MIVMIMQAAKPIVHRRWSSLLCLLVVCIEVLSRRIDGAPDAATATATAATCAGPVDDPDDDGDRASSGFPEVTIVKVGGSSITDKARFETLNETALAWFAKTLASRVSDRFKAPTAAASSSSSSSSSSCPSNSAPPSPRRQAYVVVHGAGSFGHHTAKEFGLQGYASAPPPSSLGVDRGDAMGRNGTTSSPSSKGDGIDLGRGDQSRRRRTLLQGLVQTRQSVLRLNGAVVHALVLEGINAVALSPCFGAIPVLPPTAGQQQADHDGPAPPALRLRSAVESAVRAGLVPVLHGDACLLAAGGGGSPHDDLDGAVRPSILSGDTLVEWLGTAPWASRAVFLTDVDGVHARDPKSDPSARLLREIGVARDPAGGVGGGLLLTPVDGDDDSRGVEASGSEHDHDVTGGLKVRRCLSCGLLGATGQRGGGARLNSAAFSDNSAAPQTKLSAAAAVAASGTNVTIVRCGSQAAERAMSGGGPGPLDRGTVVFLQAEKPPALRPAPLAI
jgi:isopentenyl phosphate kinase